MGAVSRRCDVRAYPGPGSSSPSAESFDRRFAGETGVYIEASVLPVHKKIVEAALSFDKVKDHVEIATTWGAKITGEQLEERAESRSKKGREG